MYNEFKRILFSRKQTKLSFIEDINHIISSNSLRFKQKSMKRMINE
jgi:hypothetical protein